MKWFLHTNAPVCGCDGYELFEAKNEDEAEKLAFDLAYDWLSSYFEIYDEEDEEEYEDLEWGHDYILRGEVEYLLEPYDPEIHDEQLI